MIRNMPTEEIEKVLSRIYKQWRKIPDYDDRLDFLYNRAIDELVKRKRVFHKGDCPYNWHGCYTHALCVKCLLNYTPPT